MFALKFASRILIVATVALSLGTASSAHAIDSFFDVFIEAMESGQLKYETAPGDTTQYQTIPTEMVSLSLTAAKPPLPPEEGSYEIDSFFDVFTELNLGSGGDNEIDSFFDVFTWLSVTPEEMSDPDVATFQIEILSMDLSSYSDQEPVSPELVELRLSTTNPHHGHITVLKLADNTYQVDSFFDVFTELTLNNGGTWYPSLASTHLVAPTVNVVPEPSTLTLLVVAGMALAVLRVRRTKVGAS